MAKDHAFNRCITEPVQSMQIAANACASHHYAATAKTTVIQSAACKQVQCLEGSQSNKCNAAVKTWQMTWLYHKPTAFESCLGKAAVTSDIREGKNPAGCQQAMFFCWMQPQL